MTELKKILAVEDEADIRMVIEVALGSVGQFELRLCESGAEALEVAPRFKPDLILLDVMMPEMDGREVLEALRDVPQLRHTPVAFLTAKVQPDEVDRLEELGAIGVIPKPFDPMTLADEVREMWDRAP